MSLYTDASLIMYPSGVKASKIYCQKPTDGSGDLTFSRASTATYIDANGARQTAASNVPRIDYTGGGCGKLLLEPQRTNLLLNSATLSTQNITTTAQSYVLSFEGTGTVTLSGTYSGSLVGTGSTPADRVNLVFTATAGTLTATVSGTVSNAQIEAATYPTSYIPTAGSTVTRLADVTSSSLTSNGVWDGQQGTVIFDVEDNEPILGFISISYTNRIFGDASNYVGILQGISGRVFFALVSGYSTFTSLGSDNRFKFAFTFDSTTVTTFLNGAKVNTTAKDIRAAMSLLYISTDRGQNWGINSISLYDTILSDVELEYLTGTSYNSYELMAADLGYTVL